MRCAYVHACVSFAVSYGCRGAALPAPVSAPIRSMQPLGCSSCIVLKRSVQFRNSVLMAAMPITVTFSLNIESTIGAFTSAALVLVDAFRGVQVSHRSCNTGSIVREYITIDMRIKQKAFFSRCSSAWTRRSIAPLWSLWALRPASSCSSFALRCFEWRATWAVMTLSARSGVGRRTNP